jgi:hypothetical protein
MVKIEARSEAIMLAKDPMDLGGFCWLRQRGQYIYSLPLWRYRKVGIYFELPSEITQ